MAKLPQSEPLSSKERQKLKALAHHLKPLVQVGKTGLSDALLKQVTTALKHHELIKVQIPGESSAEEKKELVETLTSGLPGRGHFVSRLGRVVVLYWDNPELDREKVKIPRARLSHRGKAKA